MAGSGAPADPQSSMTPPAKSKPVWPPRRVDVVVKWGDCYQFVVITFLINV
jgi:hypothetical protein